MKKEDGNSSLVMLQTAHKGLGFMPDIGLAQLVIFFGDRIPD